MHEGARKAMAVRLRYEYEVLQTNCPPYSCIGVTMNTCSKIIRFIEWYEPRLEHLKFMFSPMPRSLEYSLQENMVCNKWRWYPNDLPHFDKFLMEHYLPGIRLMFNNGSSILFRKLFPDYIPKYWEKEKIDVARTVARMAVNGGIRRVSDE